MTWYAGEDGQQTWVPRDDTIYTLVQCEDSPIMPHEQLTYLSMQTKKAVYHEHLCNEDALADGKSRVPRRKREAGSGRQRGFIIRNEVQESPMLRILPCFKDAAQHLVRKKVISRLDADEASNSKKKKKEKQLSDVNLGANQCRVETSARVNHFAHGAGFRVEVAEGQIHQRIHFFTNKREIPAKEWNASLVEAIETTGAHVIIAQRVLPKETGIGQAEKDNQGQESKIIEVKGQIKKSKAQEDDDQWLSSMMTMAVQESRAAVDEEDAPDAAASPAEEGNAAQSVAFGAAASAQAQPASRGTPTQVRPAADGGSERSWRAQGSNQPAGDKFASWRDPVPAAPSAPSISRRQQEQQQQQQPQQRQQQRQQQPQQRQQQPQQRRSPQQPPPQQPEHRGKQQDRWTPSYPAYASKSNERWEPWPESKPGYAAEDYPTPVNHQWWEPPPQSQELKQEGASILAILHSGSGDTQDAAPRSEKPEPARAQASTCFECHRGRPLKLFIDEDDGNWYCRLCWVAFYSQEPPAK